ncbi:MAG: permease [Desulfurivibrionaceae bacterium]|nr:permease [Desulfurivibrionaceae bacterium]
MKENEKPMVFRGKYFLLLVLAAYMALFFFSSPTLLDALQKSGAILLKVLPIFAVVIIFTALLNYALQPKQIVQHLGEKSGAKGWLLALLAGVISHGPMYAWYPMITDLRSQGLRDGLIVVFFYARAIKLPLLPLMLDYFGAPFTLVLSVYILIGALLQGLIFEQLKQKRGASPVTSLLK